PHGLGQHHLGVAQGRKVRGTGDASAESAIKLLVQPRLDLRMLREQVPRPGERVRPGLMTGKDDGDALAPAGRSCARCFPRYPAPAATWIRDPYVALRYRVIARNAAVLFSIQQCGPAAVQS